MILLTFEEQWVQLCLNKHKAVIPSNDFIHNIINLVCPIYVLQIPIQILKLQFSHSSSLCEHAGEPVLLGRISTEREF